MTQMKEKRKMKKKKRGGSRGPSSATLLDVSHDSLFFLLVLFDWKSGQFMGGFYGPLYLAVICTLVLPEEYVHLFSGR